jgi:hypothetical protein
VGKAAENERLKLRAVFWNNLSAGIALAGILVPLISYLGGALTSFDKASRGQIPWTREVVESAFFAAGAILAALCLAAILRNHADSIAAKIED